MQQSWHVVTAYDAIGATPGVNDRAFTVSPAAAANFGDDTIFFKAHSFDNQVFTDSSTTATPVCELNISLHNIVLDLAEAECWAMDNKPDRQQVASDRAELLINALNSMYEAPEGIGTSGTKRQTVKTGA